MPKTVAECFSCSFLWKRLLRGLEGSDILKGNFKFGRVALYGMLMHEVVSNKNHCLISEVGCLSKDLLILFS